MQRIDDKTDPPWVKVTVYGKSGSGKTTLGVTAPKPLILLSESQAVIHLRKAAKRLGVPMPATMQMENADDFRTVAEALAGSRQEPLKIFERHWNAADKKWERILVEEMEWPDTVVVDSVTDMGRMIAEGIERQAPPKKGEDGLPVRTMNFWQVLGDRFKNLLISFRDAPVHTLFLALSDDRAGEEGGSRTLEPSLPMRKMTGVLSAASNVVGYSYRREVRSQDQPTAIHFGVMTTGPEYMTLKACRPLRDVEVPNFTAWVRRLQGDLVEDVAPAPSTESQMASDPEPVKAEAKAEEQTEEEPMAPAEEKAPAPKKKAQKKAAEPAAGEADA